MVSHVPIRAMATAVAILAFLPLFAHGDDPPPAPQQKKGGWRLADEKSDYLREHASNPVEWYAWGDEAFQKAKELDRIVFLSIGYSSCHWCHVMRRESFSSEKIAAYMNDNFICIKVDREELPHVDAVYMDAVQTMNNGRGGWPLSVWLSPEGTPLVGGTYFPPEDRFQRPGFLSILERVHKLWKNDRKTLQDRGSEVLRILKSSQRFRGDVMDPRALVTKGVANKASRYDPRFGGFGKAPKFPSPRAITLLMCVSLLEERTDLRDIAVNTLRQWAAGGIYDQVGGGFHRYSVDAQWAVPHFEKMLYNQGLNAEAYLDVYRMTGEEDLKEVARGILDALLRDFGLPHGGFASSWDADSEEEEGTFYVWTPKQVEEVVGPKHSPILCEYLGITSAGNFEGGPRSVPSRRISVAQIAKRFALSQQNAQRIIDDGIQQLFSARTARVAPHKDHKAVLGWNGLAISALARGSILLGDNRYLEAARAAHAFCQKTLAPDSGFLRRFAGGVADHPATLRDVSYHLKGTLDLYEASFDPEHIAMAKTLAGRIITDFGPGEEGGAFYEARKGDAILVDRPKRFWDGAIPSGNATLARCLIRLHALTGEARYRTLAEGIVTESSKVLYRAPHGSPEMLLAALALTTPLPEIAVVGDLRSPLTRALLAPARRGNIPFVVVAHRPLGAEGEKAAQIIPLLRDRTQVSNRPAAYLCIDFVCKAPETDPTAFAKALEDAWKPKNDADKLPKKVPDKKEAKEKGKDEGKAQDQEPLQSR